MKRLKRDKRAVSNAIVVMLSLVLVVIIVANIVLWSYQMNQLDWERMQERTTLADVEQATHSSWFTSQNEYAVNVGSRVNGTYVDTRTVDSNYETYGEESTPPNYELEIVGEFTLDVFTYPLAYVQSVEIQLHYRTNDSFENWFLKAYNWTKGEYSDSGFNSSSGDTPTTGEFKYYAVNLTDAWQSYVQNGMIRIEFCDNKSDVNATLVDIDFLGVRLVIEGTKFSFENDSPLTSHIVAIWVIDTTTHKRYDANLFLDSGTEGDYFRADISLPAKDFIIRAVTERGNVAVFGSH
jgi:Tfp pilus assembly protein PilE